MTNRGKTHLAVAVAVLALSTASTALALDWPWKNRRASTCGHCGQPLSGMTYMVPSGHSCPPTGTVTPAQPAYPMQAAPSTSVSGGAQMQPGEPYPQQPSTMPGSGQPPPTDAAAQPSAPDTSAPTGGADASAPGMTSGLGGGLSEPQGALNMFGDMAPLSRIAVRQVGNPGFFPPPPPEPPTGRPGRFPSERQKSVSIVPSARSFKVADNQTPMPVDRITYSFNFFDYVNQSVNQRFNIPLERIQAYRHVLGFEKTFFDKNASFGMRLPLNTLTANSSIPNLGPTSTALGDLAVYFKYALWMDREQGRVISSGLALSLPTGPTTFGGANYLRGVHYTNLQPFLGVQWTWGDLYAINFTSIDVPMSSRDVTMFYQDIGLGYFVYRNGNRAGFIQSVAPTFEAHVNTPFNHFHPFDRADIAATSEVVDLTEGINIFFRGGAVLSLGVVEPVTGPRPFSIEALALFNVFF